MEWADAIFKLATMQALSTPEWVRETEARMKRMSSEQIAQVRHAFDGTIAVSDLDDDGFELFFDFLPHIGPHPDALKFFEEMRRRGGAVGIDEKGRMVRGLPGGGIEVIKDPGSK